MSTAADDPDSDPACRFDDDHWLTDADLMDVGLGAAGGGAMIAGEAKPVIAAETEPVIDINLSPLHRVVFGVEAVIPPAFRSVFSDFPYFNAMQSQLLPVLLEQENSVAVCAPTGSGKTALFELAIVRILIQHNHFHPGEKFIDKIIYMSPLKTICSERVQEWEQKFLPLGVRICELTGDSDIEDHQKAHSANLIVTTPEKWEAMTRKWRDGNRTIMMQTRLICIDEVHLLSEPSRGATLETIVSRVKTAKGCHRLRNQRLTELRSDLSQVTISATAPNIGDVSRWLSVGRFAGKAFRMAQSDRPVKLTQVVRGIKFGSNSPYAFDQILSRPIAEAINSHACGKPVLIFCMTRNSTSKSAKDVSALLPVESDLRIIGRRNDTAAQIEDKDLRVAVAKGVAWHHAGLSHNDRQQVEFAFRDNQLQALFSTSTLAMGVNLPAYMVIVKGVHKCSGRSQTEELSETELLQMTGRAGRPQFDDHGVALILCPEKDVHRFQRLLNGEKVLESSLHKSLPEHMNSEVVLRTIHEKDGAVQWLKSTFFFIRCKQNQKHYGISASATDAQIDQHLSTLCNKELNGLNKYGMIRVTADGAAIEATEVGRIMANYCVSFETMKSFVGVRPNSGLKDLLLLLCSCKEVKQETLLRQDEKKLLFAYSNPKDHKTPKVRFILGHKVKEIEHKIFTIWQLEFGCIEHEDQIVRFRSDITKTMKIGKRLAKCLLEVLSQPEHRSVGSRTLRNVILLSEVMDNGLWENTPHVARQLKGIGPKYSADMVRTGLTTFDSIRSKLSFQLDGICNRRPPFGDDLLKAVRGLPMYRITGRQVLTGPEQVRAEFAVDLHNRQHMEQLLCARGDPKGPTAGRFHAVYLCISDSDDKVIVFRKIRDENLVRDKVPIVESAVFTQSTKEKRNRFTVTLSSESWIGINISRRDFDLTFAFLESKVDIDLFPNDSSSVNDSTDQEETGGGEPAVTTVNEVTVSAATFDDGDLGPKCKHHCKNKSLCLHACCKTMAQVSRAVGHRFPMLKVTPAAKRLKSMTGRSAVRRGGNIFVEQDDYDNDDVVSESIRSPVLTVNQTTASTTEPMLSGEAVPQLCSLPPLMPTIRSFPSPRSSNVRTSAQTSSRPLQSMTSNSFSRPGDNDSSHNWLQSGVVMQKEESASEDMSTNPFSYIGRSNSSKSGHWRMSGSPSFHYHNSVKASNRFRTEDRSADRPQIATVVDNPFLRPSVPAADSAHRSPYRNGLSSGRVAWAKSGFGSRSLPPTAQGLQDGSSFLRMRMAQRGAMSQCSGGVYEVTCGAQNRLPAVAGPQQSVSRETAFSPHMSAGLCPFGRSTLLNETRDQSSS